MLPKSLWYVDSPQNGPSRAMSEGRMRIFVIPPTLFGRLCDVNNVRDVGRQFGEEGDLDGGSHPLADVSHQLGVLTGRNERAAASQ